jgi:hypothetical protein
MSPGVRAGLVAGIIAIAASLLGTIPALACLMFGVQFLVFLLAGVLAAAWMTPPRVAGRAAGQGALAGLIAGFLNWLASMAMAAINFNASGGAQAVINNLPPETLQQLRDAGFDPAALQNLFSSGGLLGLVALCCSLGIVVAIGFGALGGLIYAAVQPGATPPAVPPPDRSLEP